MRRVGAHARDAAVARDAAADERELGRAARTRRDRGRGRGGRARASAMTTTTRLCERPRGARDADGADGAPVVAGAGTTPSATCAYAPRSPLETAQLLGMTPPSFCARRGRAAAALPTAVRDASGAHAVIDGGDDALLRTGVTAARPARVRAAVAARIKRAEVCADRIERGPEQWFIYARFVISATRTQDLAFMRCVSPARAGCGGEKRDWA